MVDMAAASGGLPSASPRAEQQAAAPSPPATPPEDAIAPSFEAAAPQLDVAAPPCEEHDAPSPPTTPPEEEPPIIAGKLLLELAESQDNELLTTVLAIDSLVSSLAPRHAALRGKLHEAL
eukprot:COSAG02_NODE_26368_length_634_cov_1.828037_1_plen_119_part_10